MYATKPTRYYIEWDSEEVLDRLRKAAVKDGSYSDDHDDWYEPYDIVVLEDATTLAAARRAAKSRLVDAHFGQVRLYERVGIEEVGIFWDYAHTKLVEEIE